MVSRNPSEMERIEAMKRELEFCRSSLKEGFHSKATKEYLLREIRKLEKALGEESLPYNRS